MKKTRDTTGKLGIDQASRALKRLEKTLERRVGRLPGGRYAVVVTSVVNEGRQGGTQNAFRIVGDHVLKRAIETHAADVQRTMTNIDEMLPPADFFLSMPGNAEDRARRLRSILQTAWKIHVAGTPFAATKQMYTVVQRNPNMAFPWWDEIARVPFANNAVDNAEVSQRVFRYIAPRVFQMLKNKEIEKMGL
jgi:hypothetical protein